MKVILTGATGLVGEGVLLTCLEHPDIKEVLIINRKPQGTIHPKLKECIVPDFLKIDEFTSPLTGYDACFYCAGMTSFRMDEKEYNHVTYDITLHVANILAIQNPNMIFIYISGSFTDSNEKSKLMWTRVKGKTENALLKIPFRKVYNYRPGFMKPVPGQKNIPLFYKMIGVFYPVFQMLFPDQTCTIREVGLAMINSVLKGYPKHILHIKDIQLLAKG